MDSVDRYGLEASFSFTVSNNTRSTLQGVMSDIHALQKAIGDLSKGTSRASGIGGIGGKQTKQASDGLKDMKAQFRALRAESRNIEFGDLKDANAFKQGEAGLRNYIAELKKLESQITGTSASDREFKAQLQSQQRIAGSKIDVVSGQRDAASAQQKMGVAGTVAAAGAATLLPLVSIGKDAIKTVSEFDGLISQAQAVSGATASQSLKVRERAKQLGAETKFSASEAAGAFVLLGQAGYNVDQQLEAVSGTLMLAAAGGVALESATDITISTLGGFQAGADQASHYADVLAQTANAANLGVGDLGETMKYAAPAAKSFGASVEQTAAMTGMLANAGIKGSSAGTALRSMFSRLGDPTGKAKKQLEEYGIQVSDANGKFRQMPDILADMNKALTGLDDAKKEAFLKRVFGVEASSAVKVLMNNLNGVRDLTDQNLVSSRAFSGMGVAAYQAEVMQDNLQGAFTSFSSAMEGVIIEIGDVIKVAVWPAVNALTTVARGFISLPKPIKTMIVVIGGVVAALASLAAIGGTIAAGFFALQSAAATASIGMTAMATSGIPLTGFFASVMTAFTGQGITGAFLAFGSALSGLAAGALAAITSPMSLLIAGLVGIYAALEWLTPGINILGSVLGAIAAPIGFVSGVINGFVTTLTKGLGHRIDLMFYRMEGMSPVMGFLGDTVKMVSDIFSKFFGMGDTAGTGFANAILGMVDVVGGALGVLWTIVDTAIIKPIQLAVSVWEMSLGGLGTIASGVVSVISGALSLVWGVVESLMVKPIQWVVSVWESALGGLGTIASNAISAVQTALSPFTQIPVFVQGVVDQVQAIVSTIAEIISAPFRAATTTVNALWDNTGGKIASVFGFLKDKSAETGQNLVSNLAENSPGPTWQIREKWGMTAEDITTKLDGLIGVGEVAGQSLSSSLVLPKLGDFQLPELPKLGSIAPPEIGAANAIVPFPLPKIDIPKIDIPETKVPLMPEIAPPVLAMSVVEASKQIPPDAVQIPTQGVVESVNSIVQSFSQLDGVQSIVTGLQSGFDAVTANIKAATMSAVGFAITGAVAIAPLLLGITGLGILAAGIAFNFLGLRDIISGVGKAVWSILEAGKGVALGLVQVFQGVVRFIQSIPSAITGDFSGMAQSLRGVWQGISAIAESFANGVVGVFTGLSQSVRGIFAGLGQVVEGVFLGGWYRSISEGVNNGLSVIHQFGQNISSFIHGVGQNIGLIFQDMFSGRAIAESLNFVKGIIQGFANGVMGFLGAFENGVKSSFAQMFSGAAIVPGLNSIKESIQGFVNGVSNFINGLEANVKNSFAQMFSGSFLSGFLGNLTNGLNTGVGIIQQFVERGIVGFHGLIQGIQSGLNNFGQVLQGALLGGWLSHLTEVINSAKSVISNFISSITNALNKPVEAVGNTANKIKGMLGFGKKEVTTPAIAPVPDITPEVIPKISPVVSPVAMPKIAEVNPVISPVVSPVAMPTMPKIEAIAPPMITPVVSPVAMPTLTQQIQQQTIPDIKAIVPPTVQEVQRRVLPEMSGVVMPDATQRVRQSIEPLPSMQMVQGAIAPMPQVKPELAQEIIPKIKATPLANLPQDIPATKVGGLEGAEHLEAQIHAVKVGTAQMADTVGNSVSGVGQMLGMVAPQFADPVMAIGNFISTGAGLGQSLSQLKEGAGQFLPKISEMKGRLSGIIPAFGDLIPKAKELGNGLLTNLVPNLSKLGSSAIAAGSSLASELGGKLTTMFPVIGSVSSTLVTALTPSLTSLGDSATRAGSSLVANLMPSLLSAKDSAIKTGTALVASLMPQLMAVGTSVSSFGLSMLGLIPGFSGFIASASAAGVASGGLMASLTPLLVGLLPFVAVAGAVVGSLALLKAAFDNNFLGLKDGVMAIVSPVVGAFNWIGAQARLLGKAINSGIGQGLRKLEGLIKIFFSPIAELISVVVQQFQGMFSPINRVMSQFAEPLRAIGGIVLNLLILPLKILGAVAIAPFVGLFFALKGVTEVLKAVARMVGFLGSLVVEGLLLPFKAVLGVIKAVEAVGNFIGAAFNGIIAVPGMIMGVVGQIGSLMAGVASLITSPFRMATETIGNLWQATGAKITGMFGWLTGQASTTGSQLVSNLAENSPGPTWQIREKWGQTTEAIASGFGYLTGKGEAAGQSLSDSMAIPKPEMPSIEMPKVEAPRIGVIPEISPIAGIEQARTSIQGFLGSLGSNPVSGVLDSINGGFQNITNQVKSATGGMIGFAIASLTSLAPLVLGLAGVGLVIGAVTVNFLGLRDIVSGIAKAVWSILQATIGVTTGVVQILGGVIGFVRSIPAALAGDFSAMAQSLRGIWQGIGTVVNSVFNGIIGTVNGVLQSIQGVFTGFGQILRGTVLGGWFSAISEFLGKARVAIADFANMVTGVLNKPFESVSGTVDKVKGMFGLKPRASVIPEVVSPEINPVVSAVEMPKMGKIDIAAPTIPKPQIPQIPEVKSSAFGKMPKLPTQEMGAGKPLPVPDMSGIVAAQQTLSTGTNLSLDSAGNALGQFGSLVGAIAPQFAAPIMAVSSFASTASGIAPTLVTLFPVLGGLIPMITGLGTSIMGSLVPSLGGATIASGGLMAALTPLLVGLLPFVAIAGAVAGAFFLIKTAFENNFMGLGDAVNFIISPFVKGFEFIKGAVDGAIAFVGNKLTGASDFFRATVGGFLQPIFNLVGTVGRSVGMAIAPVLDVLRLFSPVLSAIGGMVLNTLAIPFKIAGGVMMLALRGVMAVLNPMIQAIGAGVGAVINTVMAPIRMVLGAINLVQSTISGVMGLFSQIPSMIGGIFNNLWNLIPAPIRWLVENAMGGMQAIGGAFNQQSQQVPQFATGGIMPHEGLAYLHPNEFVVNPSATAGNLPALNQLNSTGSLPEVLAPVPIPVPGSSGKSGVVAPPVARQDVQPILNITIGDVIIQNATDGVQAANEFLESIAPQLDRFIRNSLRTQTELAK